MRWQTKVKPPNKEHYLDRCAALGRCLKHAEIMPPFLIAANCFFTLNKAFGSDWKVLRWLLLNMWDNRWQWWKERLWWTWHYYIRLRTRDEIVELIDQDLERMTGEDHRDWPDVIVDETKEDPCAT